MGPKDPFGLAIDDGPVFPSEDMDEIDDSELKPEWPLVNVPPRDMEIPGFAMSASARSNTLP